MAGDRRGYATSVVRWYGKRTGGSDVTDVQKGLVLNDLFKSSCVKGLLMGFEAGLGDVGELDQCFAAFLGSK